MAKIIVLSILLFFLLRFVGRILILPAKIAEELGKHPREDLQNKGNPRPTQEKDISDRGKIIE